MSATQLEFKASGAGLSQCDKILARLSATAGEWVSEPELHDLSGSHAVHARIGDLRKRGAREGFQVNNRTRSVPRGDGRHSIHSEYQLEYLEAP